MLFKTRNFDDAKTVLTVQDLTVSLPPAAKAPPVLNRINLTIRAGETVCLVGESGSGKSVTSLAIMGLLPKDALFVTGGKITLSDTDLLAQPASAMQDIRARRVAMIFQEPMTALNPVMRVGDQIEEVLESHTSLSADERRKRVIDIMEQVHLPDVERIHRSYPHQLSGGQRQRIMIAMALVLEPELLIADEPTTALDVTVQANLLALLADLRRDMGVAIVLITHDLGVVAQVCDRTLVLYGGQSMELGPTASVIGQPIHPYTQGLLAARPRWEGDRTAPLAALPGHPPDLADLPQGCPFAARCPEAQAHCVQRRSLLRNVGDRVVACHLRGQD